MSDTLSTSCRSGGVVCGPVFADACRGRVCTGVPASVCTDSVPVSSFFFETFAFGATGLWGAAVLRAADLRAAVLLLVFVAIVVRLKLRSWLERVKPEPYLLRDFLLMDRLVNLARFRLVHRQYIHKVLYIRVA